MTNDRIERIKQTFSFSQVEEPIPLPHTPFFMRNRREKNTFLKISKVSSPLNSRSITPPTKIQLNNPLNMSPITPFELNEVKKNFRERIKLKRSSVILKRDGFLQENALDKKRKSVIENPFQLMMRGKIMGIRPKKEKNAMKFEKRLLRIAFDRGEKLVNLVNFTKFLSMERI